MLVRRVWVRMLVLLRLPRLVMVPGGAVLDLRLHGGGPNAARVLEHHLATDRPGPDHRHESRDPEQPQSRLFGRREARAAEQLPREHHRKDAHRDERERLMRFHELVDRLTVLDGVFGLLAGEY